MKFSGIAILVLGLVVAGCATHASPEDAQVANTLCIQGKAFLAAGKNADAKEAYMNAISHDNKNARAWNGLGAAYDLLGLGDKAQEAYLRAVELDPQYLAAISNLAHSYVEKGDPAEAVKLLSPHASEPSAPVTMKQNLTVANKALQDKDAAVSDIYSDIGSFPTEGMALGRMAEAKKFLGTDADELSFSVVPEVKVGGGTPVFTAKIFCKAPNEICERLNPKALPCVPHVK